MGSSMSNLFYPDNPNRRSRAEELSNDCQNAKTMYNTAHDALAALVAPLHGKLDQVMKILGCQTLEEFDQKVLATATGQALEDWNNVRGAYDTADMVESVIWTAIGIVSMVGLSVSIAMGVFSFGIGFAAGMAVTGAIDLVLGTIGAIIDLVNGGIQRDKLRDSINQLFDVRLKMNRIVFQTQAMQQTVPLINDWFDSLIEAGVIDQDRINASFQRHQGIFMQNLEQWTFMATATMLHGEDNSRGSWTNEDPDWQASANALDIQNPMPPQPPISLPPVVNPPLVPNPFPVTPNPPTIPVNPPNAPISVPFNPTPPRLPVLPPVNDPPVVPVNPPLVATPFPVTPNSPTIPVNPNSAPISVPFNPTPPRLPVPVLPPVVPAPVPVPIAVTPANVPPSVPSLNPSVFAAAANNSSLRAMMPTTSFIAPPVRSSEFVVTTAPDVTTPHEPIIVNITPVNATSAGAGPFGAGGKLQMVMQQVVADDRAVVSITSGISVAIFILVFVQGTNKNTTGPSPQSSAVVNLFSVAMPNLCLQPDGSFTGDSSAGQFLVVYA